MIIFFIRTIDRLNEIDIKDIHFNKMDLFILFLESFKISFFGESVDDTSCALYEISFCMPSNFRETIKNIKISDVIILIDNNLPRRKLFSESYYEEYKNISLIDFIQKSLNNFVDVWLGNPKIKGVNKEDFVIFFKNELKDFIDLCNFPIKDKIKETDKYILPYDFVINDFYKELERQKLYLNKEELEKVIISTIIKKSNGIQI